MAGSTLAGQVERARSSMMATAVEAAAALDLQASNAGWIAIANAVPPIGSPWREP